MSQQAFLQAIFEEPEDDDLRLVYADWLEEHGDASNYIRLAVHLQSHRAGAPLGPNLVPIEAACPRSERHPFPVAKKSFEFSHQPHVFV
jgi:uncharacterized protein (TIGR02996 family)